MNILKSNKAITLIALIITIIVLLILATVTINMVLGDNGLFNKAKYSVGKYENSQNNENNVLSEYEKAIDSVRDENTEIALLKKKIEDLENQVANINMKSPPIHILTATLASSTENTRAKGTYEAKSNDFSKTISQTGNNYIEFQENVGWRVKKSGFYYFTSRISHNTGVSKQAGEIYSYLYINDNSEIMTQDYTYTNSEVAHNIGTLTLYVKEGDIINYSYYISTDGFWNYAVFTVKALFE